MPQFNSYPAITELLAADLILAYKDSVGAVKTITAEDFAAAIKLLTDKSLGITNINSETTLDADDEFVIGNSGAGFNVILPLSSENAGLPFHIANKGAGVMTITVTGGDTIIGQASITLAQYESAIFLADGDAMWMVFGLSN